MTPIGRPRDAGPRPAYLALLTALAGSAVALPMLLARRLGVSRRGGGVGIVVGAALGAGLVLAVIGIRWP